MRIAFVGDSQVDEHSRLAEHDRVMDFIVHDAIDRGCAALVHTGDVYERRSTIRERESVRSWVQGATPLGPVVIVCGNHETPGEVAELGGIPDVTAVEAPCVVSLGRVAIACLPWPRRGALAAWCADRGILGSEATNLVATDLLRDVLRGLRADLDRARAQGATVFLAAAHAMVRGSMQGPDQPIRPGCDFELGLEDFDLLGVPFVALGHVHLPQDWTSPGGAVVAYTGSPRRTAYARGELDSKGYIVAEFHDVTGALLRWERVPTPATAMHLIEWTWVETDFAADTSWTIPDRDSEVRLRYTVPSDRRDAARLRAAAVAADWLARGAAEVRVEEVVIPTTRSRAPEIAAAQGVRAKLPLLWTARGDVPSPERAARLLDAAEQIEREIAA